LKQSGFLILINAHKPLCFNIGTESYRCKKGLTTFLGLSIGKETAFLVIGGRFLVNFRNEKFHKIWDKTGLEVK